MSDLLTKARDFLTGGDGWHGRLATAYAAVDAAETARAMHTTLEGILQAVDSMESLLETSAILRDPETMAKIAQSERDIAAGRTSTLAEVRERLAPTPDAPATPQVGEVWEDSKDGETVEVLEGPPYDGAYPCRRIGSPWTDPIYRPVLNGDWRRVSPAPAPLTKRERVVADGLAAIAMTEGEVTAEAQAQDGVEPASDDYAQALDELTSRALDAEARAEQAEAQVALMRPVVDTAEAQSLSEQGVSNRLWGALRAYREATRDA